jgi:hypothetical protein
VKWLPPPVPVWVPSRSNFSVASPGLTGVLVEVDGEFAQLGPGPGRLDVDLDDARVGSDREGREAQGRTAADSPSRTTGVRRAAAALDRRHQAHGQVELGDRRQEDEEVAVADLDAERRAGGLLDVQDARRGARSGVLRNGEVRALGEWRDVVMVGAVRPRE